MKKCAFLLAILMLLTVCMSSAMATEIESADQTAAFVPGEITQSLVCEALDSGQMINGEMHLNLAIDNALLTSMGADSETALMLLKVLDDASIRIGAGKTEEGLRLELTGLYSPDNAQSVSVDALIEMTEQGIALESNLIEGNRLTLRWDTLASLLGLNRQQLIAMGNIDIEAVLAQLTTTLVQFQSSILPLLEPYVDIVFDFANGLSIETYTDVPAEGGYPAAASETYITCTDIEFAALLTRLATKLEGDAALRSMLDNLLSYHGLNTADLIKFMRSGASALAGMDKTYSLVIGTNGSIEDLPWYINLAVISADGSYDSLYLLCNPGETQDSLHANLGYSKVLADNTPTDGFDLNVNITPEIANPSLIDLEIYLTGHDNGIQTLNFECIRDVNAVTTSENLPAYTTDILTNLEYNGGISLSISNSSVKAATKAGGESASSEGSIEADLLGIPININYSSGMDIASAEGGFTGNAYGTLGSNQWGNEILGVSVDLYTSESVPLSDDVKILALENLDDNAWNALIENIGIAFEAKINEISTLLRWI